MNWIVIRSEVDRCVLRRIAAGIPRHRTEWRTHLQRDQNAPSPGPVAHLASYWHRDTACPRAVTTQCVCERSRLPCMGF